MEALIAPQMMPIVIVSLAGFALLLLLALVIALARMRRFAQKIADHMTADLLSSRELLFTLYQNSPVPYALISTEGRVTFPNDATRRLLGAKGQELLGTDFFTLLTSSDKTETTHLDVLAATFKRGASINNQDVEIRRLDGTTRWIMLSVFPVQTASDGLTGLVTMVDITKQKEVDRAKTEFVSLAAHQLRTPLASLRWHVELLESPKSGNLNEAQREHVTTLARGVERMNLLIDDFLNVSRLELGTLKPDMKSINARAFIEDVRRELDDMISRKHLVVQEDIDIGTMTTDPRLLSNVIGNLLSNAVKYTLEGGSVRVHLFERQGQLITEIVDTGMGIPEAEQGRLFDKFFRATNVREEVPEGTGLGLYIAQLSAQVLGGKIECISQLGVGTTFTVTLPQT